MKARETNLKQIVTSMYGTGTISNTFSLASLSQPLVEEIVAVYHALGGGLNEIPLRFGNWDIITPNFIVEFDEEQHFNRYRETTLQSAIYNNYNWFDVEEYKNYCEIKEALCLKKAKRGKYWTSPSCEKQFGSAATNGNLQGNGSPRWKQRAFYDFCRDVFSLEYNIPVYRFSIYDKLDSELNKAELGQALMHIKQFPVKEFLKLKIAN